MTDVDTERRAVGYVPQEPSLLPHLGVWDQSGDGLAEAHQVGLWDLVGNLLASANVASGTAAPLTGGFRYTALGSSVTETSGADVRRVNTLDADRRRPRKTVIVTNDGFVSASVCELPVVAPTSVSDQKSRMSECVSTTPRGLARKVIRDRQSLPFASRVAACSVIRSRVVR